MWNQRFPTVKNQPMLRSPSSHESLARRLGTEEGGSMFSIQDRYNKKGIVSMKMRIFTMSLLTLCLALFTMGAAVAQTATTGSIEGTVTDPQGGAVPNATVTVSGPNLIRAQTAQTDDQGRYKVLNLPPGRYTVTVGATAGFAEVTKSDIEVNLSKTTSADVSVPIATAKAEVTVTSTAGAAIDVTNNTSGTNVS